MGPTKTVKRPDNTCRKALQQPIPWGFPRRRDVVTNGDFWQEAVHNPMAQSHRIYLPLSLGRSTL